MASLLLYATDTPTLQSSLSCTQGEDIVVRGFLDVAITQGEDTEKELNLGEPTLRERA